MATFDDLIPKSPNAPNTGSFSDLVPEANTPGLLESFGRGIAEGGTFGADAYLGMDKERREASRKANPWTHFAGEMLGSAAPMVAATLLPTGVGQAAAAGRAAQLTGRGLNLVRAALAPGEVNTLGQGVLQGSKLSGVYSGLSGAGHTEVDPDATWGEALKERGTNALKSGAIGAVAGIPLGAAGYGAARLGQGLGGLLNTAKGETGEAGAGALNVFARKLNEDGLTPQDIINGITKEFPSDTASAGGPGVRFWGPANAPLAQRGEWTSGMVEGVVKRAMAGQDAGDISTALKAATGQGPGEDAVQTLLDELAARHLGPLNLVDRAGMVRTGSGQNTQMAMRAAAATPGEHVGIAREGLLERQIGARGRLGQLFDRVLGSSDYEGVQAQHMDALQDAGGRAFNRAFANEKPFDLAPIFDKWEGQFDKMRGVIPDTVRQRLDAMTTKTTLPDGTIQKIPPTNLQGFIYAREGLRDLIGDLPQGNNLKRHLTQFYNDMTQEVASTNPDWAIANNLWRDGMAGKEALEAGARMSTRLNANSRENLSVFTEAQQTAKKAASDLVKAQKAAKNAVPNSAQEVAARGDVVSAQAKMDASNSRMELFKTGLVRSLNDTLDNQGETHNLTKQLLLPGAQKMLRQVLGKDAPQFFDTVRAEQAMHRTYSAQFGSQTTPLREAIDEANWAPRFEVSMMNPLTWANPALRLAQEYAARTINSRRNTDLMKLYTQTDPIKQLEITRAAQQVAQARNTGGLWGSTPVLGLGTDALVGYHSGDTPSLPQRRPTLETQKP